MAKIVAIIIASVGMVIGANLISPINVATTGVNATAGYSTSVQALSQLLPLLFVVVVMMFAIRAID